MLEWKQQVAGQEQSRQPRRYQPGELRLTSENPYSRLKKTGPGDSSAKKAEFWHPKASGHAASYQAASFNPGPPSAKSSSRTRQAWGGGAGGAGLEPTSGRVHPPSLGNEHRVCHYKLHTDRAPACAKGQGPEATVTSSVRVEVTARYILATRGGKRMWGPGSEARARLDLGWIGFYISLGSHLALSKGQDAGTCTKGEQIRALPEAPKTSVFQCRR